MKKTFFIILFSLTFTSVFCQSRISAAAVPSNIVDWAMEMAFKDQLLLPLEFHFDFVDLIPAPPNKTVQFEFPFLLGSLTMGNAAPSLKIRLLNDKDREYLPRITLIGGYYTNIALSMLPADTGKGSLSGYDYGIIFAKTVKEGETEYDSTELFGGGRLLYDNISFTFKEPLTISGNSKIDKIEIDGNNYLLHFGILKRKKNYEASGQVAIDIQKSRMFLHFMFGGKLMRYGFGIYPDAVLFIKPYLSMHFRF